MSSSPPPPASQTQPYPSQLSPTPRATDELSTTPTSTSAMCHLAQIKPCPSPHASTSSAAPAPAPPANPSRLSSTRPPHFDPTPPSTRANSPAPSKKGTSESRNRVKAPVLISSLGASDGESLLVTVVEERKSVTQRGKTVTSVYAGSQGGSIHVSRECCWRRAIACRQSGAALLARFHRSGAYIAVGTLSMYST